MEQPFTFKNLKAGVTLSALIFIIFYWLLKLFYHQIHFSTNLIDLNNLNPWISKYVYTGEGYELPVMVLTSIVYLLVAYFAFIYIDKIKLVHIKLFQITIAFVMAWIFINSLSFKPSSPPQKIEDIPLFIICLFIGITPVLLISKLNFSNRGWHIFIFALWIILSSLFLLSLSNASILDYNFFVAPALKIQQGEKLGSFLMQYNLLETYIFKVMMDFGFKLRQMQLTFAAVFILWFLFYYYIASKLIRKQFLIAIFIFLLFFLKFFALENDPAALPQQLPLRLGLWAVLLASILRFGFWSLITSLCFGIIYLLDSSFGLMYLITYIIFAIIFNFQKVLTFSGLKRFACIFFPLIGCVLLSYLYFGSLVIFSVKTYTSLNIGFFPITGNSVYWIIFALLPPILYIYLHEVNVQKKQILLFLLAIGLFQLTYFYGRSFEVYLQHIFDLLLLIIFIALDILICRFNKKIIVVVPVLLIIAFSTHTFYEYIQNKTIKITGQLQEFDLMREHPLDKKINQSGSLLESISDKNRLIFINTSEKALPDGYFNYQMGLKQIGYFSPFMTHIFADETIQFILDRLKNGYDIVFLDEETKYILGKYNQTDLLQNMNMRLGYYQDHDLYFIRLEEGAWKTEKFSLDNGLTISLSPVWTLSPENRNKIIGYGYLTMEISIDPSVNKAEMSASIFNNNSSKYSVTKKVDNQIITISLYPVDQLSLYDSYIKEDVTQIINSISINE